VLRAALWMGGTLASFMAMAIGGREAAAELTTFQILFFRSVVGLVAVSLLLRRSGWRYAATQKLGWHVLRNAAHFGGQYGWFYGLAFIPLAEVFAIEFTTPAWTALFAALLLGERFTRSRLAAVVFGIAGVWVILRPGAAVVHPAALAVLLAAAGYALSHAVTKKLAATDAPLTILFYMTLVQLPLGFVPAALHWTTPSAATWPWILLVGLGALSAHYCMARALKLADATVVVPMDFLRVPLSAVLGFALYDERIEWRVLAGTALILAGTLLNIRGDLDRAPAPADRQA